MLSFALAWRSALFLLGLASAMPARLGDLGAHPGPARDYAAAMLLATARQTADDRVVAPGGRTLLLSHGARTARAVVLLHGLTNSPRQFERIATALYAAGDNVYVPRLPDHAERGEDAGGLKRLTAEALRDCADSAVDVARGLGDSVIVMGLSAGGTMAAWVGQYRDDVRRVVVVAPALEPTHIPGPLERPVMNLTLRVPNVTHHAGADTTRPDRDIGWATRGIAQLLRLGTAVRQTAAHTPLQAREAVLLLNDADRTVAPAPARELGAQWRRHGGAVTVWTFADSLRLPHDVVDPAHDGARPAITGPVLVALAHGQRPPGAGVLVRAE